ncbi:NAD(P)/FAD-dependent oxidoreductase [Actinomadura oligospora]|uniref:NAD(P)/FAD-dependent oxidoreductase n=1 Tax=Actinomadura oligospora TaxID=111804 RepID=UPI00047D5462|nr:NAD(P)/FAD-dependent oxidoreductase [Actinomadura oligospora]
MSDRQGLPASVDVVVIGAGPGGAATASRLAQLGRSVLVLESRPLPRFHIGESLLPPTMALFERIGLLDTVRAQGFVPKYGAEFSGPSGRFGRVPFDLQGPGRHPSAFQVERARFDKMLADFAQAAGATVIEEATVHDILQEEGRVVGVRYEHAGASHTVRARHVVDAGGRASKIAKTFGLRNHVDRLRMVAVFQHFANLDEGRNPGHEGDIQIGRHKDGWIWAIPIRKDVISVGSVMRREVLLEGDPAKLLDEHIRRVPRIVTRIEGTQPGEVHVETDYCYYADTVTGPGWSLVGDAACFFDPIFSGGVLLATTTGVHAAEAVDGILSDPARTEELQKAYSDFLKTGYDTYSRVIHAYYEHGYNIRPYLESVGMDREELRWYDNPWVVRLLSGDFWSRSEINELMRKESRWDTFAPFDHVLKCPFYAELNAAEGV